MILLPCWLFLFLPTTPPFDMGFIDIYNPPIDVIHELRQKKKYHNVKKGMEKKILTFELIFQNLCYPLHVTFQKNKNFVQFSI